MLLVISVALVCGSGLTAWRWWLNTQPACTAQEFAKVVAQLNQLTSDMATVSQTADSVRTAVGMVKLAHGGR